MLSDTAFLSLEKIVDNSKILEKIQKLLRLSKSNNIHEASIAFAKAYELAAKYNIAIEIVNQESRATSGDELIVYSSRFGKFLWVSSPEPWQGALANLIFKAHGCRIWLDSSGSHFDAAGRCGDIEIASQMLSWLATEIEMLTVKHAPVEARGRKEWTELFRFGAIRKISEKISETMNQVKTEMKDVPGIENALARIDNRLSDVDKFVNYMMELSEQKNKVVSGNTYAFAKGYNSADSIDLSKEKKISTKKKDALKE